MTAPPTAGHFLRVHVDRDTAVLDVECHQPPGAYCRTGCVRPNCDAEIHIDPDGTKHPMGEVPCLAAEWFGCCTPAECHDPDAGREALADGMPVVVEWSGDAEGWVWRAAVSTP